MTQKASSTGAFPMPGDGMRRLSPQNALQRARAMACMRERSSQCQGQVHVNLFFDGTGNNRDWEGAFVKGKTPSTQTQLARSGHSNVARLFDASLDEPENGLYSFYIPGVGTPFREIGDSGSGFWDGTLGAATARWGADRINWGIIQVFNALHRYITEQTAPLISDDDARILANTLSQTRLFEGTFRRILFDAVSYRLERAIAASQRKVKSINIAVFGFSRGAAQARAFVHWLFEIEQPWNNGCGHNLAGVPMQLSFLGLFDIVASVGISNMLRITDGRYAWASDDLMSIHPDVQKCAHFVALHEQRINFPVEHDSYLAARADHPERREEWLRNGGRGMPPPVPISGLSPTFMFASDLRELFETVHRRVAVPPAATTLFDRYVHDSLAGFYIADWTELNAPVGATNGYLRYRTVYSANRQKQQQVCVDPLTTPTPPRTPPMGQWFPRI